MKPKGKRPSPERQAEIIAELRKEQALREKSYRAQALRLLPHVCARCGREFSGPRLKELTVHHKDHNFRNNPPDGSNWELLCIYCHDHEHEKSLVAGYYESVARPNEIVPTLPGNPFQTLDSLFGSSENPSEQGDHTDSPKNQPRS